MRFFVLCWLVCTASPAATVEDLFKAIRNGDVASVKLLSGQVGVQTADARSTTPLHYAAAFGNAESVKLLLSLGADVKARNSVDATPLILAASSPEKTRLLLESGADATAKTKSGVTALHVAVRNGRGLETVRRLLDAGADPNAADERGLTPFLISTMYGSKQVIRLLLDRGASAKSVDKAGFGALTGSNVLKDPELVRLLIQRGADVNAGNSVASRVRHGEIRLKNLTPLLLAAPYSPPEVVQALLAAGANVHARDGRGLTPLLAAVASQQKDTRIIRALLDAGADPNADDADGESVLDWAHKFGDSSAVKMLLAAGARAKGGPVKQPDPSPAPNPAAAVEKAVTLLQRSSTEFFRQSGCIGCHHQPAAALAERAARDAGLHVTDAGAQEQVRGLTAGRPLEPRLLEFVSPGGDADTVSMILIGAKAAGMPANSFTDAAVRYLVGTQQADGSWSLLGIARVPMEGSDITRTAHVVEALRAYGWPAQQQEIDACIQRAGAWLAKTEARTSYERADQLLGLYWAGARQADRKRIASALMREQREDGGWAQNRHLPSDAYTTGLALHALRESEWARVSDRAYQRGAAYLLKTQLADGSWYVRSRSPKFQPYFQSGFPHEHDQWISSTATAYAVMALAPVSGGSRH